MGQPQALREQPLGLHTSSVVTPEPPPAVVAGAGPMSLPHTPCQTNPGPSAALHEV